MERPKVTLYGTTTCGDCERSKLFLKSQGVGFRWVDVDRDIEGRTYVQKVNNGNLVVPTIVCERGGLVCLNSAARFDKWNRAAVR